MACFFSLATASVRTSLANPRAFGCCRVSSCGSEGLPLPGHCTHNITLPSPLVFVVSRRSKHQEPLPERQLFLLEIFHRLLCKTHLELIRAEDFSENGTRNALTDSRSHTVNGNISKKHPHHCALTLSLSLTPCLTISPDNLVWKSYMEFM